MVQVKLLAGLSLVIISTILLESSDGWSGHYRYVRRVRYWRWRPYCVRWYWWWGCSWYWYRWYPYYYSYYSCKPGWTHNGNRNCNIPVCRPSCGSAGTCTQPNICQCDTTATGPYCRTATCSYKLPCYPGDCVNTNDCDCQAGFKNKPRSDGQRDGCQNFDPSVESMYPVIGRCTAIIKNTRRTDNRTNFEYVLDGTSNGTNSNGEEVLEVWSNTNEFNILQFEFESTFGELEDLPDRPPYVFDSGFGIVKAEVVVNITKYPRSGGLMRDPGSYDIHKCPTISDEAPEEDLVNCTIYDDQFATNIEHADWMEITYRATSGGFRELRNIDAQNQFYRTEHYNGLQDLKKVKFLFDFIAPKYCGQTGGAFFNSPPCPPGAVMLEVEEEFTKDPIRLRWLGWQDDLSGLLEYFVEIFLMGVNGDGRLEEETPLQPNFTKTVSHTDTDFLQYPEFTPMKTGIYSVLLQTIDKANNSRIARRFVIYDTISDITLNTENSSKLFISSANENSDYKWQTMSNADGSTTLTARWDNHFVNSVHEQGGFLNKIEQYPTQFENIKADGILFAAKYVNDSMDDYEGQLTRRGIDNYHGIVKFEVRTVFTQDTNVPTDGWINVDPLAETYTFTNTINNGHSVRVWVRATDVMGNVKTDFTVVTVDTTGPAVTSENDTDTRLTVNYNASDAKYNYTSRLKFRAEDPESGVHKIQYTITIETFGKTEKIERSGNQSANFKKADNLCTSALKDGYCYDADQILDLDNCWFMVDGNDLDTSKATLDVTIFNRAMLKESLKFTIPRINVLHGLEPNAGPDNWRIEDTKPGGFRIAWDLPKKISCYGLANIILVIVEHSVGEGTNKTEIFTVPVTKLYFEKLAKPNTKYTVSTTLQLQGGNPMSVGTNLAVQTPEEEKISSGPSTGVIVGVALGVLAIVAITLIVFIILIRRGHFQPVRRGVTRARTIVAQKARQTFYGGDAGRHHSRKAKSNAYAYDNRQSELYIYGGMDFDDNQSWVIARADVTFETMLKSGHFANIYKASLKNKKKHNETVAAKTLKEGFSESDMMLMKAKINFTATVVGNRPNVIKFIGAVVEDHAMGPFIIYEYCEHGPLKDYLQSQKSNVTLEVQESLFRFGLDIAKGMEYLASKGIVHRRLAARNILLTFLNEIKIAGFGPQPVGEGEEDGDAEKGKKERIPIKWMGPECMTSTADATEKSDVWSYAVVLWEIFSLGSTPYENIRSRDLPGRLKKGERLQQPEYCDDTWYGVMKQCWALDPDRRPTFSEVRNQLDGLFTAAPGDDYYYYKR